MFLLASSLLISFIAFILLLFTIVLNTTFFHIFYHLYLLSEMQLYKFTDFKSLTFLTVSSVRSCFFYINTFLYDGIILIAKLLCVYIFIKSMMQFKSISNLTHSLCILIVVNSLARGLYNVPVKSILLSFCIFTFLSCIVVLCFNRSKRLSSFLIIDYAQNFYILFLIYIFLYFFKFINIFISKLLMCILVLFKMSLLFISSYMMLSSMSLSIWSLDQVVRIILVNSTLLYLIYLYSCIFVFLH